MGRLMTSAILLMSMLLVSPQANISGPMVEPVAMNNYYCGRVAGLAVRVAQVSGDDDLAEASELVGAVALAKRKLQQDAAAQSKQQREAEAMGDWLARKLAGTYARTQSRNVLANQLIACASSL